MEKQTNESDVRALQRSRARMAVLELNALRLSAPYRARNSLPNYHHSIIDLPQTTFTDAATHGGSIDSQSSAKTVYYLAYGSNLSAALFLGARGIRPLSKVNVLVPELSLTFDLAGAPYIEPCFANSARRNADENASTRSDTPSNDNTQLLGPVPKPLQWNKGMVGVLYEVTPSDYEHIIATEGGGTVYNDIIVDCYPLPSDPTIPVPTHPTGKSIKAHTLFSPPAPDEPPTAFQKTRNSRIVRPYPDYAQPSPRYLSLITTGAAENALPNEYQAYLNSLHDYQITTTRQKLGQYIFVMSWGPVLFMLMQMASLSNGKDGKWPAWAAKLGELVFAGIWWSYDNVWKAKFGDGERTEGDLFQGGDENAEGMRLGNDSMEEFNEKRDLYMV